MASNPQSQHRCVFVGNIPYDATEEQLIQICEEVGPVVSFRLVVDRETGKPKGYGFCEYKDEETALSARRNLQGYEINGRQLRVDFAENDKNSDRNRDQGRGGPGALPNIDSQKQSVALGHSSLHQPMGDSVAMAAATVMIGAFGSAAVGSASNQPGLQNQSLAGSDPLTRHLSKMSRSQLTEVLSELKGMALQNKEQVRQLLLSVPNLSKAIFQAQVMLGMVSPQMLQMPNIWQAPAQPVQTLVSSAPNLPGLPPLPQNKTQSGLIPSAHENRGFTGLPKQYGAPNQFPFPTQSHIQRPQLVPNQTLQQGSLSQIDLGHNDQSMLRSAGSHRPPQLPVSGFQPSSSTPTSMLENMDLKAHTLIASEKKTGMVSDGIAQLSRTSKIVKLNDGRAAPVSQVGGVAIPPFPASGVPGRQAPIAVEPPNIEKQAMQLPSDLDSTLLQQVLNLTPEQLASLPPDQQQQVIQLQQILRRGV